MRPLHQFFTIRIGLPELKPALIMDSFAVIFHDVKTVKHNVCQAVCAKGGDYVLALKGNQGTLFEDVKLFLDDPEATDNPQSFQAVDAGHGRIETRTATVSSDIDWLQEQKVWMGR